MMGGNQIHKSDGIESEVTVERGEEKSKTGSWVISFFKEQAGEYEHSRETDYDREREISKPGEHEITEAKRREYFWKDYIANSI